jgi:hypothetical protein
MGVVCPVLRHLTIGSENIAMYMALDNAAHARASLVEAPAAFRSKEPVPHGGMDLAPPDTLEGWTVLLYDTSDTEAVMLRAWIANLGGAAIRVFDIGDATEFLSRKGPGKVALVFEARSDELEDRVDQCFGLRARFPDCPIILISETFGKNDFSTERMAVCDASLRSPVTQVAFKLAVPAALSNNEYFRFRNGDPRPRVSGADTADEGVQHRPATDEAPARRGGALSWLRGRMASVCLTCGIGLTASLGYLMVISG